MIFQRMEADGVLHTYLVKSTAITSMGTNAKTGIGTFDAKANITDITDPLMPVAVGGSIMMRLTVTDGGEPGTSDRVGVSLWEPGGSLLFSNNWSGTKTEEELLGGGNVQVR